MVGRETEREREGGREVERNSFLRWFQALRELNPHLICNSSLQLFLDCSRLRESLRVAQKEHTDRMAQYMQEEKHIREENLRLQVIEVGKGERGGGYG